MRRLALVLLFLLATLPASAQDSRDLPLDHWAYPILERLEAHGVIELPATKPYTRRDVYELLKPHLDIVEIDGHDSLMVFGTRGTTSSWEYAVHNHEFVRLLNELVQDRQQYKGEIGPYERRAMGRMAQYAERELADFWMEGDLYQYRSWGGPDVVLGVDAAVTPRAVASRGLEPAYSARGDLAAWGRWRVTRTQEFLFDQRLVFTAEEEQAKYQRLDATTQTWRGGKFDIGYSYFRYANPHLSVTAGRKEFWWGQGRYGTMLLSTNAPAFDALSFKARYQRLGFESFIGILSTDEQRYFSGHRVTIRLPWHLTAGFSEVVAYQANNVDPVYANPILPFYGTQWNERDDDNILWNLDAKWTPGHGIKAWGELLMDDVQYEQDPPAPQKMGFLLGLHWADPLQLPNTDLIAEWAGNQKWVYTQRKHENRYVGADTTSVIGHWIGTDGDALDLMVEHRFHPRLNVGLGYAWRRHGEGRIDRGLHYPGQPYEGGSVAPGDTVGDLFVGDDPRTRFLSGTVERQDLAVAALRWEPFFWATLTARLTWGCTRNVANVAGAGRRDAGAELSLKLDY